MSKFLVFTATCFLIVLVNLTDGCNLKTSEKMFADDSGIPWPCRSYCPGIRGCMSKCCPTKKKVNEGRNRNSTMVPRLSSGSKITTVLHYGPVTPRSSPGPRKKPIWHYGSVTPRASPDPRKKPIWLYGSVTPQASPDPRKKPIWHYGSVTPRASPDPRKKPIWHYGSVTPRASPDPRKKPIWQYGSVTPQASPDPRKKPIWHYGSVTPRASPDPRKKPIWHYGSVTPQASPDPRKKPIWHYGSVTPRASPDPRKKTTLPYGHENITKLKECPQNKKVWYLLVAIFLTSGCLLVIGGKKIWNKLKNRTGNSMEAVEAPREDEDIANERMSEFPLMEGSENLPPVRIAQETEHKDLSNDLCETSLSIES